MGGIGLLLDLVLVGLLAATMLHAVRLHRALGGLRQDQGALDRAVAGFDDGARSAEAGLARLRQATEGLAGQLTAAAALRDDLVFLSDRGEGLADRLDTLVRAARPLGSAHPAGPAATEPGQPTRSQAERNLLAALQARR